jgi:hypothetical protein
MRSRPENVSMIPPGFVHYCSLKCSTGWLNILIIVHFCSESWLNIRIFTQMIVLQISGEYPNCMGQKQTKKTAAPQQGRKTQAPCQASAGMGTCGCYGNEAFFSFNGGRG